MTDKYVSTTVPPFRRSTPDFGPVNDVWDIFDRRSRIIRGVMRVLLTCVFPPLTAAGLIILWCIA